MPHVTFIHGIANKTEPDVLLRSWRDALGRDDGIDLGGEGVTSSMVYWADVLYESPKAETAAHESTDTIVDKDDPDVEMDWRSAVSGDEEAWADSLAEKLAFDAPAPEGDEDFAPPEADMGKLESASFESVPLPWFVKRRIMKAFLRDVHHYLFNTEHSPRPGETFRVQDEIRQRMISALLEGSKQPGPHVIVAHSMGTVISYDCLKRVPECPQVDALLTVGSPLGLDEIQHKMKPEWSRKEGFPDKIATGWANVFDRLDPVAGFDPKIANDYRRGDEKLVEDINEQSRGAWRHDLIKYFEGEKLRDTLSQFLEL